jgi:RecA-family ATPase
MSALDDLDAVWKAKAAYAAELQKRWEQGERERAEQQQARQEQQANGHSTELPPGWDDVPPPGDDDAGAGEAAGAGTEGGAPHPLVELFDPTTLQGKPVPLRRWLVGDWIPADTTSGLYGDGGTGKTLLAQQLQTCCATALKWLGLPTLRCRSIGLYCEDTQDELHRRQADINRHYSLTFADLADMRWQSRIGFDNLLMTFDGGGRADLTELFAAFEREAVAFAAKLAILDTAADIYGGNENIRPHVRQFISACLGRLARAIDGAVLLCAHPSRAGLTSGEGDGASTAWNNTLRSRLYLARPEVEDGGAAPDDAVRLLTRKKANYAGIGDTIELRWKDGVFVSDTPAGGAMAGIEKGAAETAFLEALGKLTARRVNLSASHTAHNYAPIMIVRERLAGKHSKAGLAAAMRSLFDAGRLDVEQYGRPSEPRYRIVETPPK